MAAIPRRTNFPPLPWYIGLAIIVVVDAFVGYQFYAMKCEAPGIAQFLVLVAVPGVYLVLMYLTFRSQS
jgi:RsiW-degrading membrane proteinase PrsW (M82 family)